MNGGQPPPTAATALRQAVVRLRAAGLDDPAVDARALLAHAMGIGPDRVTLHASDILDPATMARLDAMVAQRIRHQPVAQITGHRMFWGRRFTVTPDTLDPRGDTETLVAAALSAPFHHVLDLGTGTGCILCSLLADRPAATGVGVDVSQAALAVARANAQAHGLGARAQFHAGDWFSALPGPVRFDLIVANPPYITAAEMADLSPEVRDWEPHLALTPGGDGLSAYRVIAAGLSAHLAPGGRVMLEIGHRQGPEVAALLARAGLADVTVLPDLDGRDRVVCGRRGA